jgi:hypothetical protein
VLAYIADSEGESLDSETDGLTAEELRELEKQWIQEEEQRRHDEKLREREAELLHQRQYMVCEGFAGITRLSFLLSSSYGDRTGSTRTSVQ